MPKKYIVRLTAEERTELEQLVSTGKSSAYRIRHANILLAADANNLNWTDAQIVEAFRCHRRTVENVRQRFVEQGFEAALGRKQRTTPPRQPVLDGDGEAQLIAMACSEAPEGRSSWTLHLLADRLVTMNIVDSISHETVRQVLKKTN